MLNLQAEFSRALSKLTKEIVLVENIFICWNRNFALVFLNFSIQFNKGIDRDEFPLKADTQAENFQTARKQWRQQTMDGKNL